MRERKVLVVKTQMCRRTAQQQRVLFSITESCCQPDHHSRWPVTYQEGQLATWPGPHLWWELGGCERVASLYVGDRQTSSQMSILIEIFRHPTPQITTSTREGKEGNVKGVRASKSVGCPTTLVWLPEKIETAPLNLNVR